MITAFFRTILLYFLLMAGLRLTGKRQVGQLEPGDLVLALMIADLAAIPMGDMGIPLLSGVVPILVLMSLALLVSHFSLRYLSFRNLVCGRPVLIISEGVIQQTAMAKTRLTVDELLEQLRIQGYLRPDSVRYAVLETNGQLSVIPWPKDAPLTAGDAGVTPRDTDSLPAVLINDGRVLHDRLQACGKDLSWLSCQLKLRRIASPEQVFLMTLDSCGTILCIPKEASR